MLDAHFCIEAHRVRTYLLPEATKIMNYTGGIGEPFKSRVVDIIVGDELSICIVRKWGSYPFIENQWPVEKL